MTISNCTVNMVLTSIVNNPSILKKISKDIKKRFKVEVDEKKLEAFLNTVELEVKQTVTMV
jgi:hypothetical protein